MRLAIAGASGTVGRLVAHAARTEGHEVLELSRSTGVDLLTSMGLADRLAGVDAVVDTLNTASQRRSVAEDFFRRTTRTLLAAEAEAGVGAHICLSIVGCDRVDSGYYFGKRVQESEVRTGVTPWTILRTTQWHEFAEQALGFAQVGPMSVVPRMLVQPVAAAEVAAELVRQAVRGSTGDVLELAGPQRMQLVDMARAVNARLALKRRVVGLAIPGAAGRAMRTGALLPSGPGRRGRLTFAEWLDERGRRDAEPPG